MLLSRLLRRQQESKFGTLFKRTIIIRSGCISDHHHFTVPY